MFKDLNYYEKRIGGVNKTLSLPPAPFLSPSSSLSLTHIDCWHESEAPYGSVLKFRVIVDGDVT